MRKNDLAEGKEEGEEEEEEGSWLKGEEEGRKGGREEGRPEELMGVDVVTEGGVVAREKSGEGGREARRRCLR